jgi:uncharacterized protein
MGDTAQNNAQTVQAIYAAFGSGDMPAILEKLTDDVEWNMSGPASIPYAGDRQGKDGVIAFFTAHAGCIQLTKFEVLSITAQGDHVAVSGYEEGKALATGKTFANPWAMRFTFRDGKVSGFRTYEDTAALVEALTP